MLYVPKESFASGEIAPVAEGLGASPIFQNGCKTLTNAVLTRYGGARRRPGSRYVCRTVADHPAILIPYEPSDGTRYIVQISSFNATSPKKYRYLTVLDAFTAASASDTKDPDFVDFADGTAKGYFVDTTTDPNGTNIAAAPGTIPVGSGLTVDNCYFHPYDETELYDVNWVQYGNELWLLHPEHPPLILEKITDQASASRWRYNVAEDYIDRGSPVVKKRSVSITMTPDSATPTYVDCSVPFFTSTNAGGIWRFGGKSNGQLWGRWWHTNTYGSATRLTLGSEITGGTFPAGVDPDPADWCGPYLTFGAQRTVTLASTTSQFNSSSFTVTAGGSLTPEYYGTLILLGGASAAHWFVTKVTGTTTFEAVRLTAGSTTAASGKACDFYKLGGDKTVAGHPGQQYPCIYYTPGAESIELTDPAFADTLIEDAHVTQTVNYDGVVVGGYVLYNSGYLHGNLLETVQGVPNDNIKVRVHQAVGGGSKQRPPNSYYPVLNYGLGWSHHVGFPTTGAVHGGRLFLGGFKGTAGNVFVASRVNDSVFWTQSADDDDGLHFDVSVAEGEQVRWFASSTDFLFGTDKAEYKITGSPITPSQIGIDRQSGYGADLVRPAFVAGAAIFAQRGSAGVREMLFDFGRDRYLANDLTDGASHLFSNENQIKQLIYSASPHQLVLARTDKRKIYALTYRRENGVIGWSPWDFTWASDTAGYGGCEWVMSMKAFDGNDPDTAEDMGVQDNAYCVVKGQDSSRFIVAVGEPYTVDCQSYSSAFDATSIDGFDHFVSMETIQVMADDVYLGDFDADVSGDITWTSVGYTAGTLPTDAYVGFGFTYTLTPTIPYVNAQDGTTAGRLQSIVDARILLNDTRGMIIEGVDFDTVPSAIVTEAVDAMSGWTPVEAVGEYGDNNEVTISQTAPYYIEVGGITFGLQFS